MDSHPISPQFFRGWNMLSKDWLNGFTCRFLKKRSKRSNYFQEFRCEGVKLWWKFTTNFRNSSWCLVVFPPNKHTGTVFFFVWLRFSFKNRFESASGTVLRSLFAPWWLQQNEEDKEASVPWFIGWLQPVEAHIGGIWLYTPGMRSSKPKPDVRQWTQQDDYREFYQTFTCHKWDFGRGFASQMILLMVQKSFPWI